jgi:hypothetical protein
MYDMNTILKAMAEGKTADDLAKEFTDALNAANAKLEEDRIAEENRALENQKRVDKIKELKGIILSMQDFITEYYLDYVPADYKDLITKEVEDDAIAEALDEIDALMPMLPVIFALAEAETTMTSPSASKKNSILPNIKMTKRPVKQTIKTMSDSDANKILHDFLSNLF